MDGDNGGTPTRAVLFSLGALTSYRSMEDVAAVTFRAAVEQFGLRGDAARSYGLFCSRFLQVARWYDEQHWYRQADMLRSARLAGLVALRVRAGEEDLTALDAACAEALARRVSPLEGAFEVLAQLRAESVATAIIGNADCDQFCQVLQATGLAAAADVVLCSEEVRSCKPDPLIFYEALRRLGCRPSEALLVGNSRERDLRGAELVGLRSVLLCPQAPCPGRQDSGEAEDIILRLNEVTSLVRRPAPAGGPRVRRRDSSRVPVALH